MRLPGFTAEVATSGRQSLVPRQALHRNRSSAHSVVMATQCCPPGYDTTGCTPVPPPQECPPGTAKSGCPRNSWCAEPGDWPRCRCLECIPNFG